ncbi:DUF3019 domain-containing protein [Pseudoalteromonas sp. T1lg65]|uniref:DUF3019 domain-containing protein n=1 Tax=Pseudoalteromonas sp. T1lg65 TaxID=2077101 RepID=UPI003F7A69CA
MYFKRWSWMALLALLYFSSSSQADDISKGILNAVPNKCVALNQGRTCYADVTLSVNAPEVGDYCLRESGSKKILQCWANVTSFEYLFEFGSEESVSYELISKQQRDVLAVTTIEVNWVHKVRVKKRRWRLF